MGSPVVWRRGRSVIAAGLAVPMLRNNSFFFAATACVGLANYLLNTTAARRFPAGTYSQFGIMLNLLAAFVPISVAAGTAITRRAIANRAMSEAHQQATDEIQRLLVRHWSLLCLGGLLLVAVGHAAIGHFLRLTTTAPLSLVVLTGYWIVVQGMLQSVLQERGDYGRLSAIFLGEGVFRGLLGVAIILAGVGITGALTIYALSAVLAAFFFPRPPALWHGARTAWVVMRPIYRDIGQLLLANLSVIVLSNLDIILCRRWLTPETADRYVAIASLAKFFLFATAAISTIAFAEMIKAEHRGTSSARPLLFSFGLIAALGLLFVGFCRIAGTLVMAFAFGAGYRMSGHALWLTAGSAFAVSLITLEITFFNARNWFWYLPFLFVACAAIVGALPLADGQLRRYAAVYAIGTLSIAFLLAVPLGFKLAGGATRMERPLPERPDHITPAPEFAGIRPAQQTEDGRVDEDACG